jgi:hypothetical protein
VPASKAHWRPLVSTARSNPARPASGGPYEADRRGLDLCRTSVAEEVQADCVHLPSRVAEERAVVSDQSRGGSGMQMIDRGRVHGVFAGQKPASEMKAEVVPDLLSGPRSRRCRVPSLRESSRAWRDV